MIRLTGLSKFYRTSDTETVALNGIDLSIESGEFVAIMGPSGCGKSTLLNILGMIDSPSAGHYMFEETDVAKLGEGALVKLRKRWLGFVFQSFNLIEELTVEENVDLPLRYLRVSRDKRRARVREALELVGLNHRARHKPNQLSGGQQQRVAVARAVVADPKLILADEPTGNLDSKTGEEVLELLRLLNEQGSTIVMVTHSDRDAGEASRVIRMLDGAIVEEVHQNREVV
ncbi:MAG: ABC transporter ATP-binding protein [Myxococcota bacterium]